MWLSPSVHLSLFANKIAQKHPPLQKKKPNLKKLYGNVQHAHNKNLVFMQILIAFFEIAKISINGHGK